MKFYSEVTKEMYDTMAALTEAEAKAKSKADVEEAAKELKAAVEKLAREAAEYEKKAKDKEKEAIQLEKEFMEKYGADAFRTHLLIPALRASMSDIAEALETRVPVSDIEEIFKTKAQRCPTDNDLKDAISKFLGR